MAKSKELTGITSAAGVAGRALARLEDEAQRVHSESANTKRLQLVSAGQQFSALIRAGRTTIQIEGDSFAVDVGGEDG